MTRLAFVDTETTGLDPERHEVWEVALVLAEGGVVLSEHEWQLPVDLGRADSVALSTGHFYERTTAPDKLSNFAVTFAELTHGAHLVGAVPSFDDAFLKRLLRTNGACPGWHYHLVDVEALVAGHLGLQPPWDSNALSLGVGVDANSFERHTAMGDVRWAMALYAAVFPRTAPQVVEAASQ